jgi:hypothetical protein
MRGPSGSSGVSFVTTAVVFSGREAAKSAVFFRGLPGAVATSGTRASPNRPYPLRVLVAEIGNRGRFHHKWPLRPTALRDLDARFSRVFKKSAAPPGSPFRPSHPDVGHEIRRPGHTLFPPTRGGVGPLPAQSRKGPASKSARWQTLPAPPFRGSCPSPAPERPASKTADAPTLSRRAPWTGRPDRANPRGPKSAGRRLPLPAAPSDRYRWNLSTKGSGPPCSSA